MSSNITIPFSPESIDDEYWLKIIQVEIDDDRITLEEAADFIDALYDLTPCGEEPDVNGGEGAEEDENGNKIPKFTLEELQEKFGEQFTPESCKIGDYDTQIEIYKSHRNEPYLLRLTNGEVTQTITKEEVKTIYIEFKNSKKELIPMPIIRDLKVDWMVVDNSDVNVTIKNNYIILDEKVTGLMMVEAYTQYDLVDITVFANEDTIESAEEFNEVASCLALAFYHSKIYEKDLERPPIYDEEGEEIKEEDFCLGTGEIFTGGEPDIVTCYEIHNLYTKCQCDTDITYDVETVEVEVPCPKEYNCPAPLEECRQLMSTKAITVGYANCDEITEDINSPLFYEETCCELPAFGLPKCSTITSIYKGGKGIEGGPEQYISLYGQKTTMIGVPPKDGVCGEVTVNQIKIPNNCCEDVDPIVWDDDNSAEIIADNSYGYVSVTGGGPLLTWTIRGNGFGIWGNKRTYTTTSRNISVSTEDACGTAIITVTDGCSSVIGYVRSTDGNWTVVSSECPGIGLVVTELIGHSWGYGYAYITNKRRVKQWLSVEVKNYGTCCTSTDWRSCLGSSGAYCTSWDLYGCLQFDMGRFGIVNQLFQPQDSCGGIFDISPSAYCNLWYPPNGFNAAVVVKSYSPVVEVEEWLC